MCRTLEVMRDEHYRPDDGMIVEEWIVTDIASPFAQISDHTT